MLSLTCIFANIVGFTYDCVMIATSIKYQRNWGTIITALFFSGVELLYSTALIIAIPILDICNVSRPATLKGFLHTKNVLSDS